MGIYAEAVIRGCGTRTEGGAYAELGLAGPGEEGAPIEAFLLDPAVAIPAGLDVPVQGALIIKKDGINHLICHVGSTGYPNLADWIEEARRFGISWRLPKNLNFVELSKESTLILTHARAFVRNQQEYPDWRCRWGKDHDAIRGDHCSGVWWTDVEAVEGDTLMGPRDAEVTWDDLPRGEAAAVTRRMPSFTYQALTRRKGAVPHYEERIFGIFPIGRLVVVKAADGSHTDTLDNVKRSGLQVDEVDL